MTNLAASAPLNIAFNDHPLSDSIIDSLTFDVITSYQHGGWSKKHLTKQLYGLVCVNALSKVDATKIDSNNQQFCGLRFIETLDLTQTLMSFDYEIFNSNDSMSGPIVQGSIKNTNSNTFMFPIENRDCDYFVLVTPRASHTNDTNDTNDEPSKSQKFFQIFYTKKIMKMRKTLAQKVQNAQASKKTPKVSTNEYYSNRVPETRQKIYTKLEESYCQGLKEMYQKMDKNDKNDKKEKNIEESTTLNVDDNQESSSEEIFLQQNFKVIQ